MKNKNINFKSRAQDLICFYYIKLIYCITSFYGTTMFLIKAFIFGVNLSGKVKCWGIIHIMRSPMSEIKIGDKVFFASSSIRCTASSIYAPVKLRTWSETSKIIIEDNVSLNGTSITSRSKVIHIGEGTMIAPNVVIIDSDFHSLWAPDNRATNPGIEEDKDVTIGKNVWIGMQSIILKGISIGDNSVIAAGSIVTNDIPSNVLAGGVPARVIRNLT